MNKKIWVALLPLGLGVAFVGVSAATGRAVTSKLAEQTAHAKAALPQGAVDERIESGIWTSTRTLTFHMGCPPPGAGQAGAPLTFRWRDVIQHGPLPGFTSVGLAQIDSSLELPPAYAEHLQTEGGGKWMLKAHTRVGFGGEIDSKLTAPAAKLAAGSDALQFSALDAHVTGKFPFHAGPLTYDGSFAPFDLQQTSPDSSFHVTLGRFHLQGQVQLDPAQRGLFMPMRGQGHMTHVLIRGSAPSATTGAPSELAMGFNDVSFTHALQQDKDLWSMQTGMRASSEILGFAIDKLEFNTALRGLHEPSYLKLARSAIEMSSRCDPNGGPQDPSEMLAKMEGDLIAFLSHDPEYSVGPIALEIGGKRAELSYRLGTKGISAQDQGQPLPALLLSKSVGHAEAAVDLPLIDLIAQRLLGQTGLQQASAQLPAAANPAATAIMARAMIEGFVSQGYLTRDGERVKATLDTQGENVLLNGKPFSVADMLGPDAEPDGEPEQEASE